MDKKKELAGANARPLAPATSSAPPYPKLVDVVSNVDRSAWIERGIAQALAAATTAGLLTLAACRTAGEVQPARPASTTTTQQEEPPRLGSQPPRATPATTTTTTPPVAPPPLGGVPPLVQPGSVTAPAPSATPTTPTTNPQATTTTAPHPDEPRLAGRVAAPRPATQPRPRPAPRPNPPPFPGEARVVQPAPPTIPSTPERP